MKSYVKSRGRRKDILRIARNSRLLCVSNAIDVAIRWLKWKVDGEGRGMGYDPINPRGATPFADSIRLKRAAHFDRERRDVSIKSLLILWRLISGPAGDAVLYTEGEGTVSADGEEIESHWEMKERRNSVAKTNEATNSAWFIGQLPGGETDSTRVSHAFVCRYKTE